MVNLNFSKLFHNILLLLLWLATLQLLLTGAAPRKEKGKEVATIERKDQQALTDPWNLTGAGTRHPKDQQALTQPWYLIDDSYSFPKETGKDEFVDPIARANFQVLSIYFSFLLESDLETINRRVNEHKRMLIDHSKEFFLKNTENSSYISRKNKTTVSPTFEKDLATELLELIFPFILMELNAKLLDKGYDVEARARTPAFKMLEYNLVDKICELNNTDMSEEKVDSFMTSLYEIRQREQAVAEKMRQQKILERPWYIIEDIREENILRRPWHITDNRYLVYPLDIKTTELPDLIVTANYEVLSIYYSFLHDSDKPIINTKVNTHKNMLMEHSWAFLKKMLKYRKRNFMYSTEDRLSFLEKFKQGLVQELLDLTLPAIVKELNEKSPDQHFDTDIRIKKFAVEMLQHDLMGVINKLNENKNMPDSEVDSLLELLKQKSKDAQSGAALESEKQRKDKAAKDVPSGETQRGKQLVMDETEKAVKSPNKPRDKKFQKSHIDKKK